MPNETGANVAAHPCAVRYEHAGALVHVGLTATRQSDDGGSEVWLFTDMPSLAAPGAGDTFAVMGSADPRVRTVTAVTADRGTYTLTCSVPAVP